MPDLISREKVMEILVDTIDGGEECRGRDAGITAAYDKIRALPADHLAADLLDERIIQQWGWRWTARDDYITCFVGASDEHRRAREAAARILNRIVGRTFNFPRRLTAERRKVKP